MCQHKNISVSLDPEVGVCWWLGVLRLMGVGDCSCLVSSCGAAQMPGCGIPTCLGLGYLCIQQWGAPVLEYPGVGGLGCKVLHSQCV